MVAREAQTRKANVEDFVTHNGSGDLGVPMLVTGCTKSRWSHNSEDLEEAFPVRLLVRHRVP
jgi:hypothetical protein